MRENRHLPYTHEPPIPPVSRGLHNPPNRQTTPRFHYPLRPQQGQNDLERLHMFSRAPTSVFPSPSCVIPSEAEGPETAICRSRRSPPDPVSRWAVGRGYGHRRGGRSRLRRWRCTRGRSRRPQGRGTGEVLGASFWVVPRVCQISNGSANTPYLSDRPVCAVSWIPDGILTAVSSCLANDIRYQYVLHTLNYPKSDTAVHPAERRQPDLSAGGTPQPP